MQEVVKAEQKQRDRARRAAGKTAKPLWEEDGKVRRGLMDMTHKIMSHNTGA